MFASKHTRVEIPSKSFPTLRKDLHFSASSRSIHEKVFPAKYQKSGENVYKRLFTHFLKQKKWTETFIRSIFFQQLWTIILQNSGLLEILLSHSQHCSSVEIRLLKKVLILLWAKQTAVLFWWMTSSMKLKCMILITNVHFIWVKARNSAV